MTMDISGNGKTPSQFGRAVEYAFNFFLRLLAVFFFALSLFTWLRAIGYWEGAENRFDTMSTMLKIYTAIMIVLLPVTSVGLWTTLSWGRVVWLLAIGIQIVGVLRYGQALGLPEWLVFFHLLTLALYVIFQLALRFIDKKE